MAKTKKPKTKKPKTKKPKTKKPKTKKPVLNRISRLGMIPKEFKNHYRRAWNHRGGKDAIYAFCLECMKFDKIKIKLCKNTACPLYEYKMDALPKICQK